MIEIPAGSEPWIIAHRATVHAEVRSAYARSVLADFAEMEPWLPATANVVAEIGCGIGGIAALLGRRYPAASLILVDGDGPPVPLSGWYGSAPLGTSRAVADELLAINGVQPARWLYPSDVKLLHADVVVSLFSWGFHYGLDTYPSVVAGTIVVDVRKSHADEAFARFGSPAAVIRDMPKYFRAVWSNH